MGILQALFGKKKPCYRCGIEASETFAGYDYCSICKKVVSVMQSVVRHDPPFGFPGASGYTEFPGREGASHG